MFFQITFRSAGDFIIHALCDVEVVLCDHSLFLCVRVHACMRVRMCVCVRASARVCVVGGGGGGGRVCCVCVRARVERARERVCTLPLSYVGTHMPEKKTHFLASLPSPSVSHMLTKCSVRVQIYKTCLRFEATRIEWHR